MSARCVAHDLHTIAPRPLKRTWWRQFAAQWGDCKTIDLHLSMRLLLSLSLLREITNNLNSRDVCLLPLPPLPPPLPPPFLLHLLSFFLFFPMFFVPPSTTLRGHSNNEICCVCDRLYPTLKAITPNLMGWGIYLKRALIFMLSYSTRRAVHGSL